MRTAPPRTRLREPVSTVPICLPLACTPSIAGHCRLVEKLARKRTLHRLNALGRLFFALNFGCELLVLPKCRLTARKCQ